MEMGIKEIQDKAMIKQFNKKHPVGSEVTVIDDLGNELSDTIKYPASIMGGHTPVAWLIKKGSYCLERVR